MGLRRSECACCRARARPATPTSRPSSCDGCFENGKPRRYADVKRLNDGLRRARPRRAGRLSVPHEPRGAAVAGRVTFATAPRDLSDLLLLDVEAGICERASRIEEAITAVQTFIRRARLGLEPGWTVTREFARMWDREFANFHVWQACKRRHLYKENWIEWDELEKARRIEAFRFLEDRLRSATLTVAAPGGLEWWPDERPPHPTGCRTAAGSASLRASAFCRRTREGIEPARHARNATRGPPGLRAAAAAARRGPRLDPPSSRRAAGRGHASCR